MITEKDARTYSKSKHLNEFKELIPTAFNHIILNKKNFEKYDCGMDRIQVKLVVEYFDKFICRNGGFEVDARTLRHAHGIGNNNEYDVVDKDLVKVASFYCNSDMFGGVFIGVIVNGETFENHHLR